MCFSIFLTFWGPHATFYTRLLIHKEKRDNYIVQTSVANYYSSLILRHLLFNHKNNENKVLLSKKNCDSRPLQIIDEFNLCIAQAKTIYTFKYLLQQILQKSSVSAID